MEVLADIGVNLNIRPLNYAMVITNINLQEIHGLYFINLEEELYELGLALMGPHIVTPRMTNGKLRIHIFNHSHDIIEVNSGASLAKLIPLHSNEEENDYDLVEDKEIVHSIKGISNNPIQQTMELQNHSELQTHPELQAPGDLKSFIDE
jgi:hypothetical protein